MIARKKILAFLLLMMFCSTVTVIALANNSEEPDIETETELVPYEAVPTSEDYVDSPYEAVLSNNDINETKLEDVMWEIRHEYNLTFQIISIDKGTFDEAIIVNATTIRFNTTEILYGASKNGSCMIRLFPSSPAHVEHSNEFRLRLFWGLLEITFTKTNTYDADKVHLKETTKIKSVAEKTYESETSAVPEFPAGNLIALGTGMGILIIFLFRRKNMNHTTKQKRHPKHSRA